MCWIYRHLDHGIRCRLFVDYSSSIDDAKAGSLSHDKLVDRRKSEMGRKPTRGNKIGDVVLWDGKCPFCGKTFRFEVTIQYNCTSTMQIETPEHEYDGDKCEGISMKCWAAADQKPLLCKLRALLYRSENE